MNDNATLKSSWMNGIIGAALVLVVGMALRIALWHFQINLQDDLFILEFITNSLWLLVFAPVIPVVFSLISYGGYVDLVAKNAAKLHLVARGEYGRPWILALILTVVLEVIWLGVCVAIMYLGWGLDPSYYPEDAQILQLFLGISGLGLLVDVVMFLLSNRFFKPNTIMPYVGN